MDYLKFCHRCKHYEFNFQTGILCGLTHKKPIFETVCKDFVLDPERDKKVQEMSQVASGETTDNNKGKMLFGAGWRGILISMVIWIPIFAFISVKAGFHSAAEVGLLPKFMALIVIWATAGAIEKSLRARKEKRKQLSADETPQMEALNQAKKRTPKKEHTMTNDNSASTQLEDLFLHIPILRLILLSIASCGIYEAYWIYKNWRFIKERQGLRSIRPFWRGVFGVFFCHSLLREIHTDEEASALLKPSFSPSGLATGWVILVILANLIARAPGIAASVIAFVMPSYLFLVPVQNYINSVTERRSPSASYYGWSSGHVVCLLFGIVVWALTFFAFGA